MSREQRSDGVWAELVGQRPAVAVLRAAAEAAHAPGDARHAMTHAWLITGPPGAMPLGSTVPAELGTNNSGPRSPTM